ncbi:unnamed protein product [Ceutorhynchus assimilis]|uniref:Cytochrome P450 n=1 Tax=Ceutorhynchus assimilis TaxID=467358 RepID=A0A9N9QL37_9CUCU|nr:unnamed protein product [Ceutorhynchus assimilis]
MFFAISSAVVIALFLIIIFTNLTSVKEYIRYWILLRRLPDCTGKQFLIGHAGKVLGLSPVEAWLITREWLGTSPPIYKVFLGPTLVNVGVSGAKELEAVIGKMKNLEKSFAYSFLHSWLERGLLTSTGSKWQTRRKILTPAFHFSILLEFVDIFNRETKSFLKEIQEKYLDKPVDIVPLISNFTLLTMSETSMGTKLDLKTEEGMKYKNAIYQIGSIIFQRIITPWLWYPKIFNLTSLRKVEKTSLKVLHNFTNKIIQRRSENFKIFDEQFGETFTKRKHPLLDVLLNAKFKYNSIDDIGIREEVDTFMFEGHDTTSICLNFTTMLLACHKDIQEKVYHEIISYLGTDLSKEPSYADLQQMDLLERCIKEGLRLYPPVPLIGRTTSEEIPTDYGIIPKETQVFTYLYDLHRNPKYWSDPDKFDPSRHLPENCRDRHPFAFVPFSAGPRNCIGQRFAMLEIKSFFSGLLRKFVLEPVDTPETIQLIQDMILRPANGIKVKFILRNK